MDKVLLLGIGGSGMSKLALLMKDFGFDIYGLDIKESKNILNLRDNGVRIQIGPEFLGLDETYDLVVYSSAIPDNNRTLTKAKEIGIKVERRGETLARISKDFSSIVVSGTHGKTTTSAMIGHILNSTLKANVYVGAEAAEFRNFSKSNNLFVIESDESDGTFLYFNPYILVITNIDRDHLNFYNYDFEKLKEAFSGLISKSTYKVVNMDDGNALSATKGIYDNLIYYSLKNDKSDMFGYNLKFFENGTMFDLKYKGDVFNNVLLPSYGEHNVLNAMASFISSDIVGISLNKSIESIHNFVLPSRRMEKKWENKGILLIDDHADHPTEVESTLTALRKNFNKRRIVSIFQPHRFTRVNMLREEVVKPFHLADVLILTDIFSAFEQPIDGISGEQIYEWSRDIYPDKDIYFVKEKKVIPYYLKQKLRSGDLVVLLGPGDIGDLSQDIYKIVEEIKI